MTLGDRPKRSNLAERYYADDLGFSVREMVFEDTYMRKLAPTTKAWWSASSNPKAPLRPVSCCRTI